jgi:hypothetical protein
MGDQRKMDAEVSTAPVFPWQKKQPPAPRNDSGGRAVFVEKLGLFLFLGGKGRLGGQGLGGALLEFVYATGGVHKFLLAGVKRMAGVANADDNGGLGGARFDHVATGATNLSVYIFRMNVRLHKKDSKLTIHPRDNKLEFWPAGFAFLPGLRRFQPQRVANSSVSRKSSPESSD